MNPLSSRQLPLLGMLLLLLMLGASPVTKARSDATEAELDRSAGVRVTNPKSYGARGRFGAGSKQRRRLSQPDRGARRRLER